MNFDLNLMKILKSTPSQEFSQSMSEGTTYFDATEEEVSDRLSFEFTNDVEDKVESDSLKLEGDDEFDEKDNEELDEVDDLSSTGGKVSERKSRRKMKKRRTLQFRNE